MRRTLSRDGDVLPVYAKAIDLLLYMVEHRGRVLDKDELIEQVWPDQFVEENNLTVHVADG